MGAKGSKQTEQATDEKRNIQVHKSQSRLQHGITTSGGPASQRAVPAGDNVVGHARKEVEILNYRQERDVQAGTKKFALAQTLKGTVRRRRDRVRKGLVEEPILRELIQLPKGEELNDWLAVNTIHFFNIASMVYGTCLEYCTEESCPIMSAGQKYQFLWADGVKVIAPQVLSARQYMSYMFDWIEEQLTNQQIFPSDDSAEYPADFQEVIKTILKRIMRMYAHVYYHHFSQIRDIGAEVHLNSSFQHFACFVVEFGLVDDIELRPLKKLLSKLVPGFE